MFLYVYNKEYDLMESWLSAVWIFIPEKADVDPDILLFLLSGALCFCESHLLSKENLSR